MRKSKNAQNVLRKVATHRARFEQTYFYGADKDLDLIYAVNVMEHIHEWCSLVAQAMDCLKPGGELVLIFPTQQFLTNLIFTYQYFLAK